MTMLGCWWTDSEISRPTVLELEHCVGVGCDEDVRLRSLWPAPYEIAESEFSLFSSLHLELVTSYHHCGHLQKLPAVYQVAQSPSTGVQFRGRQIASPGRL